MISLDTIKDRLGKIERPYPWERGKMTICIAAIAGSWKGARLILCSDRKLSGPFGSAETKDKELYLTPGIRCLTAGYESDIISLTNTIAQKFAGERLDETNLTKLVKEALQHRKREKADEITSSKFGVSYDFFLNSGKNLFPAEIFKETLIKIEQTDLGAELVIAGFLSNGAAMIVETNTKGEYSVRDNFGIAGEARYLATAALLQREITDHSVFMNVLYAVYEAKRYAERVPSVGSDTTITVLSWSSEKKQSEVDSISSDGLNYLADLYKKYGPQTFPTLMQEPEKTRLFFPF